MSTLEVELEAQVERGLAELERHRDEPYYDAATDEKDRDAYYAALGEVSAPALTRLLQETHTNEQAYNPPELVYPWLDLHEDGLLRSIYSDKSYQPEDFIRSDAEIARKRIEYLVETDPQIRSLIASSSPAEIEQQASAEALEAVGEHLPYNCEHVVCQSWFDKEEPMRGDLHHLFACEWGCNSFRGNYPYYEFGVREVVREECGRREEEHGFEPGANKGPVARATLYFLLRYPGVVGDAVRELQAERLPVLLSWHGAEPVSEHELHRNAAAAAIQGNRNPLIDHPERADSIDFARLWADPVC